MVCERARALDAPALAALDRRASTHAWTEAQFQAVLGAATQELLVLLVYRRASAGVQREVLAYCAWQLVTPEAEIHGLAVRVEDQGHGWGRRLLSLVIERARRRGAAQAWLEVRAGNTRARKLYASAGFVEAGRRADYYRDPAEDALILRCALTSAGRHEEP